MLVTGAPPVFDVSYSAFANPPPAPSKATIIAWLQHQEGLVRSADCEFEVRQTLTRQEMVPLVREMCRLRGTDPRGFIYTEPIASANTFAARWWRKGPKERIERWNPQTDPDSKRRKTLTFDGQIIRSTEWDRNDLVSAIHSIASAEWNSTNRLHPFSLLYQFQNVSYSILLNKAAEHKVTTVVQDGKPLTKVVFRHPTFDWRSFALLFDEQRRLIQRQVIAKIEPDKEARLYQEFRFSEYDSHADPSGEKIWFPRRCIVSEYLGALPDGRLVEYTSEDIQIKRISFNVDLPDEKFVLQLPPEAPLYDGLSGLGWVRLPQSAQQQVKARVPALAAKNPAQRRVWLMGTGIVLLVSAGFILVRRFGRRVHSSPGGAGVDM